MISSDSFVFNSGNNTKNGFNFLATRSLTRPTFLDLGCASKSFLEAGIQSSQHGTITFSIQLLYPLDHKPSTRLGFQAGVPIHIPRQRQDWWCSGQEQGRRNIEKSGNGDEFQGMPNRNE